MSFILMNMVNEVFSNFKNVKKSISGDAVDDLCFFDVYGYMYVNVLTFNQAGTDLYYANPYGVMECSGWFQFAKDAGGVAEPLGIKEGMWGYAYVDGVIDPASIGDESVKNTFVATPDGHVKPEYNDVVDDTEGQSDTEKPDGKSDSDKNDDKSDSDKSDSDKTDSDKSDSDKTDSDSLDSKEAVDKSIKKETNYDADGNIESYYVYEYNEDGSTHKQLNYYSPEEYDEESDSYIKHPLTFMGYNLYEYDANGNQTKDSVYDSDGKLESYNVYTYDKDGYQIKVVYYDNAGMISGYGVTEYNE